MNTKDFDIITKVVILVLINGLTKRFSNLEQSNTLTICTFLDPRLKQYPLADNVATETKNKTINAIAQITKNKIKKPHE